MGDVADPAAYCLEKAEVPVREEVPLIGLRDERTAPNARHVQRHTDFRPNAQASLDPHQLLSVLVHAPTPERLTRLKTPRPHGRPWPGAADRALWSVAGGPSGCH